jgi:aminodeoxyfutalosine synthase
MASYLVQPQSLNPIHEKVGAGERLSFDDGVTLWRSPDPLGVGYPANQIRERMNGDQTYFIHNRHINPTIMIGKLFQINLT